jgi:hypothetical protein
MKSKDQLLIEEAYNSIQITQQYLTEGVSDKIASYIWQTFASKFPDLAATAEQAATTLIQTKDLDKAIDIVTQGFNAHQPANPTNEGLMDTVQKGYDVAAGAVRSGIDAATPYVQGVQGLIGAGIDAVKNLSVGDFYKLADPNTYLSLVNKVWPELYDTFTTHFHELLSGTSNDDWEEWAKNPKLMIAKKVGIVVLLALLAYGAKKYAERKGQ